MAGAKVRVLSRLSGDGLCFGAWAKRKKEASCSSLAPPVRHHPRRSPLPPQKVKTIIIKLLSSAGTGYFYATKKNPTNIQHKLAFMKVRLPSSPSRNNCARLAGRASLPASALGCCVLQVRMRAAARYGAPELRPRRARDSPHPHPTPPHPTPPTSHPPTSQYDPIVREHVLFTEAKMVKGRGGRRAGK
jgi:ribosomal protein L33